MTGAVLMPLSVRGLGRMDTVSATFRTGIGRLSAGPYKTSVPWYLMPIRVRRLRSTRAGTLLPALWVPRAKCGNAALPNA